MPIVEQIRKTKISNGTLTFKGVSGGIVNRGTSTVLINGEAFSTNEGINIDFVGPDYVYDQEFNIDFEKGGVNKVVAYMTKVKN